VEPEEGHTGGRERLFVGVPCIEGRHAHAPSTLLKPHGKARELSFRAAAGHSAHDEHHIERRRAHDAECRGDMRR
jgi:hypothetical protein